MKIQTEFYTFAINNTYLNHNDSIWKSLNLYMIIEQMNFKSANKLDLIEKQKVLSP